MVCSFSCWSEETRAYRAAHCSGGPDGAASAVVRPLTAPRWWGQPLALTSVTGPRPIAVVSAAGPVPATLFFGYPNMVFVLLHIPNLGRPGPPRKRKPFFPSAYGACSWPWPHQTIKERKKSGRRRGQAFGKGRLGGSGMGAVGTPHGLNDLKAQPSLDCKRNSMKPLPLLVARLWHRLRCQSSERPQNRSALRGWL